MDIVPPKKQIHETKATPPNLSGFYGTTSGQRMKLVWLFTKKSANKRGCSFRALMSRLAICFQQIQVPPGDSRFLIGMSTIVDRNLIVFLILYSDHVISFPFRPTIERHTAG
jgi:hypothetical protein